MAVRKNGEKIDFSVKKVLAISEKRRRDDKGELIPIKIHNDYFHFEIDWFIWNLLNLENYDNCLF